MKFNLLLNEVPDNTCVFKSADENVATVDENTGVVTAVGTGTTFVKLYNGKNELYAAVKVNVNEQGNKTQPKVVGGYNHL